VAKARHSGIIRTFKCRLPPTRKQHDPLDYIRREQCVLYNTALFERSDCYRKTGKAAH
jgi:hypothetical protein